MSFLSFPQKLKNTLGQAIWASACSTRSYPSSIDISPPYFYQHRAQCEIWYQQLLEADIELAGQIAMHHGSISKDLREWVEDALYDGRLKAVVCTSSLDLGVDFRPVEAIVQIGSPKGVARFIQRAGRSGHQPEPIATFILYPPTPSNSLKQQPCAHRSKIRNSKNAFPTFAL